MRLRTAFIGTEGWGTTGSFKNPLPCYSDSFANRPLAPVPFNFQPSTVNLFPKYARGAVACGDSGDALKRPTVNGQRQAVGPCVGFASSLELPTVNCRLSTAGNPAPAAEPQPQREQRGGRANRIQHRVVNGRTPAGHEDLMKLIGQGIRRGNQQRNARPTPPPAFAARAHGAVEHQEVHKILGEMRALPDDVVHVVVLPLRQPRNQPAQHRLENPFRVIGGKRVRGHGENHARPDNRRPPRPQPRHPARRRSLRADFRQAWCGARIAPRLGVWH